MHHGAYDGFDAMPLAGTWRGGRSGQRASDTDPYTGDELVEIPLANEDDVDAAYRSARDAQPEWAAAVPAERAAVLRAAATLTDERHDEIVDWLVCEAGSTRQKAEFEWAATRAMMWEAASFPSRMTGSIVPSDIPGKESRVYRRPVGVVGMISPWNFPLYLSNRSVAPALAVGNGVVIKPASDTPVTGGLLLAKIFEEAGVPAGLLNVVVGRSSVLGDPIVQHEIPQLLSFTGSTAVGEGIMRKAGIKKLALELGGNGPLVVLDDADLDLAVDAAVFGNYFHQGQICIATNRLIVDTALHDEFVSRFVERVSALRLGDPRDEQTQLGPVINRSQLESIQDTYNRAVEQGAVSLLSGEPSGPTGQVLPPHVLLATADAPTAAEEVFGPVATIIRAKDENDALRIANHTRQGLSSGVITSDTERGLQFALQVEAGMVHVNDVTVNDDVNTAFGGEKASGIGRFGGEWALSEFTTDRWISVQHQRRPLTM